MVVPNLQCDLGMDTSISFAICCSDVILLIYADAAFARKKMSVLCLEDAFHAHSVKSVGDLSTAKHAEATWSSNTAV